MMTDIYIAQAIGTLGCSVAAGGIMTLSIMNIPNLTLPARRPPGATIPVREVPGTPVAHLTHQWLDVYERGKQTYPLIALGASLANGYLAWALRDVTDPAGIDQSWTSFYVTAIAVTLGIVPWTLTVMKSTNDRLQAHATRDDAARAEGAAQMVFSAEEKARRAQQDEEVPDLLQKWARLNLYRAVFPFIGAVISFCGAVSMY
ncbi:hypothetical protein N7462_007121 [Penicillium macrosclerotiorum]|uniref:uncharacterized protein n=1 Tax=Penicillium macrosclerotiorum TaxID=303699 RepID=UPI0025465FCA|nr:uncharacterized protein N7462_007121 [Penicillium macrosclerotiorum]KAJ5678877.1 hypothetical protein N7462_007121 [Penicillium macrosclerotiorum]